MGQNTIRTLAAARPNGTFTLMRARRAIVFLVVATSGGCLSFADLQGGSPKDAAPPDAMGDDGLSDVSDAGTNDASDSGNTTDGAQNLLVNPGFEEIGAPNCGFGWSSQNGVTTFALKAGRDGGHACEICTTSNTGVAQQITFSPNHPPTGFYGSGWIAPDPPALSAAGRLIISIHRADAAAPTIFIQQVGTADGGWLQLNASGVSSDPVSFVQFAVTAPTGAGGCLLVDDVSLTTE
jgi:hypothetical protein